jgi:hypothetical protein
MRICQLAVVMALLYAGLGVADNNNNPIGELAKLVGDTGCRFVPEHQTNDWRDAGPDDYTSDRWAAIREIAGVATPWRAVGDFNGDGLSDTAKVVIRKRDGRWMFGVDYGFDATVRCDRFQIYSDTASTTPEPIRGLITLPRGADGVACFHLNAQSPVRCKPKDEDSALATRQTDALIAIVDDASIASAYLWAPFRDTLRSDGSPLMHFESYGLSLDFDLEELQAMNQPPPAAEAQAGDAVDPKQRKRLIDQFEMAYAAAYRKRFRATTITRSQGQPATADAPSMELEFLPPNRQRIRQFMPGGEVLEMLSVDGKSYSTYLGQSSPMGDAAPVDPAAVAAIGGMRIVSIRAEQIDSRAVDTLLLAGTDPAGGESAREISIDRARQLPLREIERNSLGESVTRYEFDVEIKAIEAPDL